MKENNVLGELFPAYSRQLAIKDDESDAITVVVCVSTQFIISGISYWLCFGLRGHISYAEEIVAQLVMLYSSSVSRNSMIIFRISGNGLYSNEISIVRIVVWFPAFC